MCYGLFANDTRARATTDELMARGGHGHILDQTGLPAQRTAGHSPEAMAFILPHFKEVCH